MKPILFNADMVCAILEGRKTVTRRVVKPQPPLNIPLNYLFVPPYRPGDILYVRETWCVQSARRFDADARIMFKAGGDMVRIQFPGGGTQHHSRTQYDAFVHKWADDRWHPPIHMPREAARIFLRVTQVSVERLQDITELDILEKEGIEVGFPQPRPTYISLAYAETRLKPEVRKVFANLWDGTIKRTDRALYGWAANPWVWVIEFERCERPGPPHERPAVDHRRKGRRAGQGHRRQGGHLHGPGKYGDVRVLRVEILEEEHMRMKEE